MRNKLGTSLLNIIWSSTVKNMDTSNENTQHPTVGVAIITYKDKKHLEHSIPPLLNSPLKPKVIVFNSDPVCPEFVVAVRLTVFVPAE